MYEKFFCYKKKYSNQLSKRYISYEVLINSAKKRLEKDTVDYSHKYSQNEIFNIDFEKIKENSEIIKKKLKSEFGTNLNNSYDILNKKKNYYKMLKNKLFVWNGVWSNFDLFYKDKNRIKYKIRNHYTKSFIRPFLKPILDINYYMPKLDLFYSNTLFNDNDIEKPKYKNVCLDIDKILNHMKDNNNNNNDNIINEYSFMNDSKQEDKKVIEKEEENKYDCCLVKVTHHIKGYFLLREQDILFRMDKSNKNNKNEENEENDKKEMDDSYDDIKQTCFGSYLAGFPKDKDFFYLSISFNKITLMFKRIYYYRDNCLEIFTTYNKSYYFKFKTMEIRNNIYKTILAKLDNKINNKSLESIVNDWKNYTMSNYELLLLLNIYSDRSYKDLTQYPVLPWIFSNYKSKTLNEKEFFKNADFDESLYRDLTLPLGMITTGDDGARKEEYINNLQYLSKNFNNDILPNSFILEEQPYNYGSHYSNPLYVNNFLTRIFPFSIIYIEIQGDKFDDPDRLFIEVSNSYYCSTTQRGDVRELIPEFYSLPEIYYNINNFDLGKRKNEEKVSNVKCPEWSGDNPFKFLTILNTALESDYVSQNINNWIDLIFGYKQRGRESEKANNIYKLNCYVDLVPIDKMNREEKTYYFRYSEFGICPRQIFKKPFEKREKHKKYKELIEKNLTIISFGINDDKKDKKNDNANDKINDNKKIVGIFLIEKREIKILFDDFTGIDLRKEKNKDNFSKCVKYHFNYGHGLIINDILLGNAKLNIENIPFVLYNNNQFLIEGGFINGEIVISDLNNLKGYLLFNNYDHSPVIDIQINKEENLVIMGNLIGNIYLYTINADYLLDFKKKISIHSQKINSIFISDELNAFISSSKDNYVNIFTLPSCKVIHSLFIEEPEFALLSSRPLAVSIIYSNKNKKLMIYSVNGNFVTEMEIAKKPECPLIYTDKYFRDHLIFVNNGAIFIYSLPYLENINKIQLIEENKYHEFDLFIKCYQNKSNNSENLFACDRNEMKIYIIGDN